MKTNSFLKSDLFILILLAAAKLVLHLLTNHQYGFHRDELATLNDARNLAWGFIAYPPLTPFLGRIELELFGTSLVGFRFFSALAQSIVMVIAGLMAKELGGSRRAQVFAALGAGIGMLTLIQGAMFQYVAFDYLWVVLLAYFTLRLLKTDDPRWWLGMGATIGLGMMTRYTMGVHVVGLVLAVLLTPARKYLKSPWLWAGAAVAFVIHERDVSIGRAEGYLTDQLLITNPFMIPVWISGLLFYFRESKYRMLGWMYVLPVTIFFLMQGRGYYPAPVYAMLVAAGMVVFDKRLTTLPPKSARRNLTLNWVSIFLGFVVGAALMLPVAPVNSWLWNVAYEVHDNFAEQIGWREMTAQIAEVYHALPADEKSRAGILAANYGEAGAINLYGSEYGLPEVISPTDSFWLKGAPDENIDVLVVVGYPREIAQRYFLSCEPAGRSINPYHVPNEESEIGVFYICRGLHQPWSELWNIMRMFM
jgi:hypothetical protein